MGGPTKRMSMEEKRKVILDLYHTSKSVYTEKEILALAAKAGVNSSTYVYLLHVQHPRKKQGEVWGEDLTLSLHTKMSHPPSFLLVSSSMSFLFVCVT